MKLSDQDHIIHQGFAERVNLTIDVKPNAWMQNLIQKSYEDTMLN